MSLVDEIQTIHDRGVQGIADEFGKSADLKDPLLRHVAELIDFRREEVAWAPFDDTIMQAATGGSPSALMTVIPPDHKMVEAQQTLFRANAAHDPPVLFIKPARIERRWAGIGQLHEVGHLYDWVRGIEPKGSNDKEWARGEVRAHEVELGVIELITGGDYSSRLRDFARAHGVESVEQLIDMVAKGDGILAALERVDSIVALNAPRSQEERGFRYGSHIALLGLLLLSDWGAYNASDGAKESFILRRMMAQGLAF